MTDINIENLFEINRFGSGWQLFVLCFYFPIGFVLAILRFFIGLNALFAIMLVPRVAVLRSCILRTMCLILGILIREENVEEKNSDAKILISNHTSILDDLAIDLVLPCVMPTVSDLPHFLNWCLGYKDFGSKEGHNTFLQNVKKYLRESVYPLMIHPEGTTTNGNVGLLKFSVWPFSLGEAIHPVVLKVTRPFLFNIAISVIGSHWWSDLFWFFFTPCTIFTLRYLPKMRKNSDESDTEFSKRAQVFLSNSLNIQATNFTSADKAELTKKLLVTPQLGSFTTGVRRGFSEDNVNEFNTMVEQVQEVLPYVPVEVIRRDLVRTRNVDITITNILEGLVPYIPQQVSLPSTSHSPTGYATSLADNSKSLSAGNNQSSSASKSATSSGSLSDSTTSTMTEFSTAASTFGKTADERMMSYQERKQRMIENARRRYIEKHNL